MKAFRSCGHSKALSGELQVQGPGPQRETTWDQLDHAHQQIPGWPQMMPTHEADRWTPQSCSPSQQIPKTVSMRLLLGKGTLPVSSSISPIRICLGSKDGTSSCQFPPRPTQNVRFLFSRQNLWATSDRRLNSNSLPQPGWPQFSYEAELSWPSDWKNIQILLI